MTASTLARSLADSTSKAFDGGVSSVTSTLLSILAIMIALVAVALV